CSGLVKYVFAQLGVSLPHYAAAQYYSPDAVPVAANHLRAGDLVFFTGSDGTRKMPGHVGIYIGDGYLIDAPHTGAYVEIDSLDERWFANTYVGARRVIGTSLAARRVPRETTSGKPVTAIHPVLPVPLAIAPLGQPLTTVTAVRHASPGSFPLAGVGLGLFLPLFAGGLVVRRRKRPAGVAAAVLRAIRK